MKTFLGALAITIFLIVAYSVVAFVVGAFMGLPLAMEPRMAMPLSLPSMVYSNVAPDSLQLALASSPTGGLIEKVLFFAANVLIYSLPIFGLIRIFRGPKGHA